MRPSSAEPAKASVCVEEEGEREREGDLLRHDSDSDGVVDRLLLAVCHMVHLRREEETCAERRNGPRWGPAGTLLALFSEKCGRIRTAAPYDRGVEAQRVRSFVPEPVGGVRLKGHKF